MKIFAGGIATETNTFSSIPTGLEDFAVQRVNGGGAAKSAGAAFDLAGTWGRWAAEGGHAFVPSLMAWAEPGGTTVRAAYETLREELLRDLVAAMPVDIVLLMLHGAMVAQGYDDCEEDLIRRVREIAGPAAVIGVELDLHCHLSAASIAAADIAITYKEYPHVDINERAKEVFDLAVAAKGGAIRPAMALFDCRMIGFYPTTRQPLRGLVDAMSEAEHRAGVLSISFGHGFPHADVPHVGAKMLVITDDDPALALAVAGEFGHRIYALRREIGFDSISLPLEGALTQALASKTGPVVVADQSDNTGGGAPGDATFALRWLLEHEVASAAIAILHDPEVVKIAKKAGVGATLPVRLGGKSGPASGDPVDLEVTVECLREDYQHGFPQQTGDPLLYNVGDVAGLRCGGIDIVVGSHRCQCFAPSIFTDLDIDVGAKRLLVVKSIQHFHGAFAALAAEIIYMAGPGGSSPDPRFIAYQRVDTQGLYPWAADPLRRDA